MHFFFLVTFRNFIYLFVCLGNLPTSTPCVQTANRDLQACYGKIGLTADMFISNETEIKGAIIGKDNQAAAKFCG